MFWFQKFSFHRPGARPPNLHFQKLPHGAVLHLLPYVTVSQDYNRNYKQGLIRFPLHAVHFTTSFTHVKIHFYLYMLVLFIHWGHAHAMACEWRSEGNFQESLPHHVGPRAQGTRPVGKHF